MRTGEDSFSFSASISNNVLNLNNVYNGATVSSVDLSNLCTIKEVDFSSYTANTIFGSCLVNLNDVQTIAEVEVYMHGTENSYWKLAKHLWTNPSGWGAHPGYYKEDQELSGWNQYDVPTPVLSTISYKNHYLYLRLLSGYTYKIVVRNINPISFTVYNPSSTKTTVTVSMVEYIVSGSISSIFGTTFNTQKDDSLRYISGCQTYDLCVTVPSNSSSLLNISSLDTPSYNSLDTDYYTRIILIKSVVSFSYGSFKLNGYYYLGNGEMYPIDCTIYVSTSTDGIYKLYLSTSDNIYKFTGSGTPSFSSMYSCRMIIGVYFEEGYAKLVTPVYKDSVYDISLNITDVKGSIMVTKSDSASTVFNVSHTSIYKFSGD